jgi:hypothetical protein
MEHNMKVAKRRLLLHVNLREKTVKTFETISDQMGMKPYTLASRLMRWFVQQDDGIRERILGLHGPEEAKHAAEIILKRIASENADSTSDGSRLAK